MSTIIGIDLGTSTTETAVIKDGKPVMILNFDGKEVFPSVVGIDDNGETIVGEKAQARLLTAPDRTVREVKRLIGTSQKVKLGEERFTPVEISSKILAYVREYASKYLNEEIDRAVISVPAYFDDIQRRETVDAGKAAGFTVERIINEPTAAALSYGIEHMEDESHILVYDFGGGTFDVTLLELFEGSIEVKASSGDNKLGGKDFDNRLVDYLCDEFKKKNGIDLSKDAYAMARVHQAAIECKIALSEDNEYHILIPMLATKSGKPYEMDETITREQFEQLIADLVERTHRPIDTVLVDGNVSESDIDLVLLVGGSTRVPFIRKDIEEFLGIKPSGEVNPDYAVAEGAAIMAGILSGEIDSANGIFITDVNPYSLGVRSAEYFSDDIMSIIIPRNVTIPVTRKEIFSTFMDNQTGAIVDVYQGESSVASMNNFLGTFNISGIPPKVAGKEKLEISFSYNVNGMLNVTAKVVSTGKQADISINMMEVSKEHKAERDVSNWKESPLASDYRSVLRKAEKMLKEEYDSGLEDIIYELKVAIIDNDKIEADALEDELREEWF
jgi:molecular chaperone DnaK